MCNVTVLRAVYHDWVSVIVRWAYSNPTPSTI